MSALYNAEILRLATSIPHLGRLETPGGISEKRAPLCGSRVTADVSLDAEGRISALGLQVNACALGQASAALIGQHAIGKTVAELEAARDALSEYLSGKADAPGSWPGLGIFEPAIPYTSRHGAILLAFEAVAEAAAHAKS